MSDKLPTGPHLAAAIAVEVMGWGPYPLSFTRIEPPGFTDWWCDQIGLRLVRVDEWRPDTDPTTFFRDVVPAMRERAKKRNEEMAINSYCYFDGIWKFQMYSVSFDRAGKHANIATAGCQAALAAVRSEAAEAAEEE